MYVDKINVFDMPTYLDAYPVSTMPKIMKWYILVQLAYWFQTLLGVNLEVKRKDFWPTVTHREISPLVLFDLYCDLYCELISCV